MLDEGFFDPMKPWFIRWGSLPHWRQDGATYFVTFRLSDALPHVKLMQLKQERLEWLSSHSDPTADQLRALENRLGRQLSQWLDQGHGSCVLARPDAQEIVESALRHFDGDRYELGDHAVSSNHVHALLRTASDLDLSSVLYTWKRFTATRLLRIPEIREAFRTPQRRLWQSEFFDHIVRNRRSLEKISAYIRNHQC